MFYIIEKTGSIYNELTLELVNDCINTYKSKVVVISRTRPIKFEILDNYESRYIPDFTKEELKAGEEAVKALVDTKTFKKYKELK